MFQQIALVMLAAVISAPAAQAWTHYGGDQGGTRYVDLDQINTENVSNLEIAWEFHTGDLENRPEAIHDSAFEGTPILNNGNLVFCTPFNEIIALDPGTGEERWRYDAEVAGGPEPCESVCLSRCHPMGRCSCGARNLLRQSPVHGHRGLPAYRG